MLIKRTTEEVRAIFEVQKYHKDSSLRVIGTITQPITIETPVVAMPDVNNDADWQQLTSEGTLYQLDPDNTILVINGALGLLRIHKPAGDDLAVDWKW
jgi:hypothetical protein